ncbi:MAG TPA: protein-glutamate O-methyltransferase CheR [Firmicutes bacterium]|nr:protein-glutamate O-methyltransferase CheR [Bacillota bacterium]
MPPINWDYSSFKAAFFKRTGLELERYKDKQMERRIRQFMQRKEKPNFRLFFEYLSSTPSALEDFMNYLTINTSEFFRDEKVYDRLQEEIFVELLKREKGMLRFWSAGCSVGAEPYTIAIAMDLLQSLERTEVVASDLDDKALEIARQGLYSRKMLGKTREDIIKRYFLAKGENYEVIPKIKEVVTFWRHNLLTDPPYRNCHMIFCRNVFIYFKPETQEFLLERFSSVLKPGGYLVIGSAEYISDPAKLGLTKRHNSIYQKSA